MPKDLEFTIEDYLPSEPQDSFIETNQEQYDVAHQEYALEDQDRQIFRAPYTLVRTR